MTARRALAHLLAAATLLGAGCDSHLSFIPRSAVIPTAGLPARIGLPLDRGELRLAGQIKAVQIAASPGTPSVSNVADGSTPGLFVPVFELAGSAYYGLGHGFELGGEAVYGNRAWSYPDADNLIHAPPPMGSSVGEVGGGLRFDMAAPGDAVYISGVAQVDIAFIPEAVYIPPARKTGIYHLDRLTTHAFALPNFAGMIGWVGARDHGVLVSPYLLTGYQRTLSNVLLNLDTTPNEDLEYTGLFYAGIGFDVRGPHAFGGIAVFVAGPTSLCVLSCGSGVVAPSFSPALTFTAGWRVP